MAGVGNRNCTYPAPGHPRPNAFHPGVTWCTCKAEEIPGMEEAKYLAAMHKDKDKACCHKDEAQACRIEVEAKAKDNDEAKPRREAAVTSWRRCDSHTLQCTGGDVAGLQGHQVQGHSGSTGDP